MPVSEVHRTQNRMSSSRSRAVCREVTITPTDTVIGKHVETGEERRIDLSALDPNVGVVKALVGSQTIGQVISIRGPKKTWKLVLIAVESS